MPECKLNIISKLFMIVFYSLIPYFPQKDDLR